MPLIMTLFSLVVSGGNHSVGRSSSPAHSVFLELNTRVFGGGASSSKGEWLMPIRFVGLSSWGSAMCDALVDVDLEFESDEHKQVTTQCIGR